VDLRNTDAIAVYGLHPIMRELGVKLKAELKPGSIVVSNAFPVPDWKPCAHLSKEGVHIYKVPGCWESK
jgi:hypothetical protein